MENEDYIIGYLFLFKLKNLKTFKEPYTLYEDGKHVFTALLKDKSNFNRARKTLATCDDEAYKSKIYVKACRFKKDADYTEDESFYYLKNKDDFEIIEGKEKIFPSAYEKYKNKVLPLKETKKDITLYWVRYCTIKEPRIIRQMGEYDKKWGKVPKGYNIILFKKRQVADDFRIQVENMPACGWQAQSIIDECILKKGEKYINFENYYLVNGEDSFVINEEKREIFIPFVKIPKSIFTEIPFVDQNTYLTTGEEDKKRCEKLIDEHMKVLKEIEEEIKNEKKKD